jgi:protein-histidine pros-kinase
VPDQSGENETELSRLKASVASSDDAMFDTNLDGIITSWNPAAEYIFGYSATEIIGRSFSILLPIGNADEGARNIARIRNGQNIEHYETVRIRKDGGSVPVAMTVTSVHDAMGTVTGGSLIVRDLSTNRKLDQKFRDILESTPDAMVIVDKSGTITITNSQTEMIFGYSKDEMIGQPVEMLIPSRFHANHPGHRDGFFAHSRVRPMGATGSELYGCRKNGREFPVEISLSPINTGDGFLVAATVRDATEHKQMIRRLEEMNELRNEFVAVVAHDLRAPMMSISGFGHLLDEQWDVIDDAKKRQYTQIMARNSDALAEFVEDVLQVARMDAGEYSYNISPFDIRSSAQNALDDAMGANGDRRFELIAPDQLPLVLGDEERQMQILANLISNAVKFSPAEEPVVVELFRIGDTVKVSVTDRGTGIAKDDLSKLFQKSGRLYRPGDERRPGNGLGLYICKTLVEAQGGRIWCDSSTDQGSTFSYTIPAVR